MHSVSSRLPHVPRNKPRSQNPLYAIGLGLAALNASGLLAGHVVVKDIPPSFSVISRSSQSGMSAYPAAADSEKTAPEVYIVLESREEVGRIGPSRSRLRSRPRGSR